MEETKVEEKDIAEPWVRRIEEAFREAKKPRVDAEPEQQQSKQEQEGEQ